MLEAELLKERTAVEAGYLEKNIKFRLLQSVLNQVRERIYVVGTDYRYRYANNRVTEFEGWAADEIIGRHVIELVGPLIFKRLVKPRLDRCFCGENVNFQHWVTTRSGQRQYIDVDLAPLHDWNGAIDGAIVTIRDKTAQKELKEELRDQADLYRQIIENSLAGIAIFCQGKAVFANQALKSMFGYSPDSEALEQDDHMELIALLDRERIQSCQEQNRKGYQGPRQYTSEGVRKDGSSIKTMVSSDDVLWCGRWARQLVVLDISKQVAAERALEATAANFKDVVEGSLQGFFVTQDGRFVHVNKAYVDLLGYSEEELKSAPVVSFYAPHEQKRMNSYQLRRWEELDVPEVYQVDALHKDGRSVRLQQCVKRVDNWFGEQAILGFAIDVTSEHLAKKALQEERNLLRAIIDNIPAIVFAKDRDGRFLIKNKAGAAFVGESHPADLIGKDNADYYPEPLASRFRANERLIMETGQPLLNDEQDVICPADGRTVRVSGHAAPLRNAENDIVGIVGVGLDITKRRRAEMALRESEQRFKDIAEVSSDWFWEMDADLRFSYLSDRTVELAGTNIPATLGKKRSEIDIEINDACRQHFDDLERHRPFRDFRYVKRGDDGKTYHISISGVPIFDENGNFEGYRGAGTNITREVETQRALAKERNLLRAIIDNIPDAIYAKDREARFILKNQVAVTLMGAEAPSEVIGTTDFDYYPETIAEAFYRDDMQVIESGIPIADKIDQHEISEDGVPVWYNTTKTPLRDADDRIIGLVGISRDISEAKQLSDRLEYQATHDGLTGLLNRIEFERRLEQSLNAAKSDQTSAVLCYIDLDQFKMLNDSAGHIAGDRLLHQLADLFAQYTKATECSLARLGGDEFGLLIDDCPLRDGESMAQGLIDAVNTLRFSWGQQSYRVSISVGITVINERIQDVSELLARADVACYAAKDNGRNRLCVYRSSDQETRERHQQLLRAASLKEAIEDNRLQLVAQPIVRLGQAGRSVSHYEILLRLKGKDDELLLPGAFIPAAERYGLMVMIDQWVVRNAFEAVRDVARPVDGRRFNINLSAQSLTDDAFQDMLRSMLNDQALAADSLCFEITETAVISNLGRAQRFVRELRDLGCLIALDDFGCGLSSFSYLKQFPADFIKIDGSFIKRIAEDVTDRAIVEAINHVGHVCNIQTIAECVEDESLIGPLQDLQVDYVQGYAVGPPIPLTDTLTRIRTRI